MRLIFLVNLMMGLSSITSAQQGAVPVQTRFSEAAAYKVDATSVDIIVQDQTPREYPQVGHLAPKTFEQALRLPGQIFDGKCVHGGLQLCVAATATAKNSARLWCCAGGLMVVPVAGRLSQLP